MKVQIIQLEPHDDYISTRDKMGWIKTGRIVLVWPSRGHILSRKLDLVLLQRHSKALGVKFALITSEPDVIHNAGQLGIPIFENVRQASVSQWRTKHRRIIHIERDHPPLDPNILREQAPHAPESWTVNPLVRIVAFTVSIVALLALVSFFIPSAHLKLTPTRRTQQIKMTVIASPSSALVNIKGEVPAHKKITIVEGKGVILTTGSMHVPDQFAIGGVLFTNLTEEDIEINEGTIVSTLGSEPVRFATTKSGHVDGGIGRNIILPTHALIPGEKGNVSEESILAIEGPLGLKLSVLNPMRTHGGSQTIVPSASNKDITSLNQRLTAELQSTALNELTAQLEQGEVLIDGSLKLGKIIEETYEPPKDQPANQLELTLQLEFEILTINENDINKLANLVLDANLPEQYQPVSEQVVVQSLNEPTLDENGVIHWQMIIRRDIMADIDRVQAINMILGLTTNEASRDLANSFDLMELPDITLTPRWWPRVPFVPFRVQVSNLEAP